GKSTLFYVLCGKEDYEVPVGEILFSGEDLLEMEAEERSSPGLSLAFQYKLEIHGVATMTFIKDAMNAQRKARGEVARSSLEFMKAVKDASNLLDVRQEFLKRPLNVGFSGGEKKRAEILQMALLEPKLCILDETDSGLDIDALKIVSEGVNKLRSPERSMLVITHYQRLLNYIVPDVVHVFSAGRVVETGDKSLALELEAKGYADFDETHAA